MPYTPKTVPKQQNTKTAKQKKRFAATFNAVKKTGASEAKAFAIANASASGTTKHKKKRSTKNTR